MDDFAFVLTKSKKGFVRITGPDKNLLIDCSEIGRIFGQAGRTTIVLSSGSSESAEVEPEKLIEGFLAFLDEE